MRLPVSRFVRLVAILPLSFFASFFGAVSPVFSQESATQFTKRTLNATALPQGATPPKIDGSIEDNIWKRASKAEVFVDPQTGKPVSDQTEVYLIYDKECLYVAYYCHDAQPEAIVARETVRNAELFNDDHVRLDLDPFLTYKREDYVSFSVNAKGTSHVRFGGGRAGKLEWQGDWEASAQRVKDGWTAEMRIPWGILSYPRSTEPQTIGINFWRQQQRTQIQSMWSDLGPQRFNEREGLWKGVQTPVQAWKPRISFLPYIMPISNWNGGDRQTRIGVDARYQPTPELTAVGTLNPDFASVEGAVEGIFFSRSERYVPDRRPFFLEGQDYFGLGRPWQLGMMFDPSNISRFDTGMKLYGKLNPATTVGLLGTVNAGDQTNFVANIRREITSTSNVNLLMMQRLEKGADNTVLGYSQNYRRGKWGFDTQYFQSMGPGAGGAASTAALNLEDKNFFATLRYRYTASGFLNRLGYVPFVDYHGLSGFMEWGAEWRKGFWRGFGLAFFPTWDWHTDGTPFRRQAGINLSMETRSDNRFSFFTEGGKFDRDTDILYGFGFTRGVTNRFRRWGIEFSTGKQANLPYSSFGPSFSFRFGKRFDFIASSFIQNYQGVSQQHIFTFNYEINPYQSWGGRMVLQDRSVNFYLSYRNAGRRGTDTYFIIGDPNATVFTPRIMFKWVLSV